MKHKWKGGANLALLIVIMPVSALAAAAPDPVIIGTASVTSSALSLWIAREQGFFQKYGVEARTILIPGGQSLISSLMAGHIHLLFLTGGPVVWAVAHSTHLQKCNSPA